ncbi:glycoside hydrolase family 16 protein [Streptomyces sp. SID3343]|uniref:glycoside hydrolase family 16 protein n=1 Tax=Streptomyces sp. SID3343 TaxID=2690260 RepID=UPI001371656F|nr:glycoside hydrolase family 16 protein [Streptomyces sp. SID3343]MYV99340.1 family 16 glycosylhydrolase [Streptomyces sp. SID3343]
MRRCAVVLVICALLAACGTSPPGPERWRVVFADDFDGSAPDSRRWVTCYDWNVEGCTNAGNREQQWYRPERVRVAGGQAVLSAVREPTRGSDGVLYPWASGMVSSGRPDWSGRPRFTFTYGRVEAELMLPRAPNSFPAFWLMPASRRTPPELDVVELIGSTGEAMSTVHWLGPDGARLAQTHASPARDWDARFHRFALEWSSTRLTWSIDGERVFEVTDPARVPHEPMEVLFTLAMGYPGPVPEDVRTAELRIDSVRVWQRR